MSMLDGGNIHLFFCYYECATISLGLSYGGAPETGAVVTHNYSEPGVYSVQFIGSDTMACNGVDTAMVQVTSVPRIDIEPQFEALPSSNCQGASAKFFNTTNGNVLFNRDFGGGGTSTNTDPVHNYPGPGTYDVALTAIDPICRDTVQMIQQIVIDTPTLAIDLPWPVAI